MSLLITIFLVLINIYNTIQTNSPQVEMIPRFFNKDIFLVIFWTKTFPGGGPDCHGSLAHCLHCLRLCQLDRVRQRFAFHWSSETEICLSLIENWKNYLSLAEAKRSQAIDVLPHCVIENFEATNLIGKQDMKQVLATLEEATFNATRWSVAHGIV